MPRLLPWLAVLVTITIWASYLVVVRAGVTGALGPFDIGLLRTAPAALALLPFTLRNGLFPEGAGMADIGLIGLTGGCAFILFLAFGLRFAPTADSGVFTPTMLPVWVALLSLVLFGQRYRPIQLAGLALVLAGAGALGGLAAVSEASGGAWRGHVLFSLASLSWALYTIRFPHSGLSPVAGVAIMTTWPAIFFAFSVAATGTSLHKIPADVLLLQLGQGLGSGLIANFTFLYAVRALGHAIPAASAALVPILAGVGAWIFLAEPIGIAKALGMGIAAIGVVLASGVLPSRKRIVKD